MKTLFVSVLALASSLPALADDGETAGHVRLPLQSYQELQERARVNGAVPDDDVQADSAADRPVQVVQAQVQGRLEPRALKLEVRVTVEGSGPGWHLLPVLPLDVAVEDALVSGGGTLVSVDGMRALAFQGTGRHTLVTHLVTAGNESGGMRQVQLVVLPGTSREWSLELARGVDAEVVPAELIRLERSGGKRVLRGHLPASAEDFEVRWSATGARAEEEPAPTRTAESRSKEPPRINVQTSMLASVGERLLTVYTTHRYSIFHAPVSHFEWTVPKGAEVLGVQGRGVSEWACPPGDGERTCSVELPFPVQRSYELSIQLEQPLPKEATRFAVPIPLARGVQRTSGHVAVEVMGNAEVKSAPGGTATPEDVRELPQDLFTGQSTPILLAFKFMDTAVKVVLDIARRESLEMAPISIDDASFTTVWTTEGRTITEGNLQVRNRQRQFLALGLPPGAVIQSAFVGGAPVKPSTGEDGRLRVPLRSMGREQDSESFLVQVVYAQDGLPLPGLGRVTPALPSVDAEVGALHHTLVLPDEQYLWAFGGDLLNRPPVVVREAAGSSHRGMSLGLRGAMAPPPSPQAMYQVANSMNAPVQKAPADAMKRSRSSRQNGLANVGIQDERDDGAMMEQAALPMSTSPLGQTGVLPVRIQIPQSGDRYTVHAFYVPPNKVLSWHARVASSGVQSALLLLLALLGLGLGVLLVRNARALFSRAALRGEPALLLAGTLLALVLAGYLGRQVLPLPLLAVASASAWWGWRWVRSRAQVVLGR